MPNEAARAEKFLYTTLMAYAPLTALVGSRIYSHPGEPSATWPMVTYAMLSAPDVSTSAIRVLTRPLYVVRAIARGGERPEAIADAIDEALEGAQGVVVGGDTYVAACFRESAVSFSEQSDGVVYRHLGGNYRLDLHQI